jgi:hypothetical protein
VSVIISGNGTAVGIWQLSNMRCIPSGVVVGEPAEGVGHVHGELVG